MTEKEQLYVGPWINRWMDKQMDGWDEWMGWMDRQMDRRTGGQMDGRTDEWVGGWMDG